MAGLVYVLLSRGEAPPGRAPGQQTTRADRSDSSPSSDSSPDATAPSTKLRTPAFEAGGQLEVTRVRVNRNGREYLTEVDFSYDNQTQETLRTIEDAKLITASGKALPVFFVAFTGKPHHHIGTDGSLRQHPVQCFDPFAKVFLPIGSVHSFQNTVVPVLHGYVKMTTDMPGAFG